MLNLDQQKIVDKYEQYHAYFIEMRDSYLDDFTKATQIVLKAGVDFTLKKERFLKLEIDTFEYFIRCFAFLITEGYFDDDQDSVETFFNELIFDDLSEFGDINSNPFNIYSHYNRFYSLTSVDQSITEKAA